ncbi:MAG: hypothetical protein ACI8WB_003546 [Phenylobacterium sp.]|jgi:hypothetical protein
MSYSRYLPSTDESPATLSADNPPVPSLVGQWTNTNVNSQGIGQFEIKQDSTSPTGLVITVSSQTDDGLKNWGATPITTVFEDDINQLDDDAFIAEYQFDFLTVRLQGNTNLGLIIMTALNTFSDDSGRMNYFAREYYRRQD